MTNSKKKIVVAGGGFGGIIACLKLAKKVKSELEREYELILVDRHEHQLYAPALYEISSIPKEYSREKPNADLKTATLIPLADVLYGKPIRFIKDEITGLDPASKKIFLEKNGELRFEYLIIAAGSETNHFGIPGLKESSFPLKTFDDAVRLRDAIEEAFRRKNSLRLVVGGGGPTGVELAAEFVNLICALKENHAEAGKTCDYQIVMVEAAPEILPGFETAVVNQVKNRLEKLGVRVVAHAPIKSVSKDKIYMDAGEEPYDILVWTGGIKGPAILEKFGLKLSPKGTIVVNEYLETDGDGRIYAIGDDAFFMNTKTGRPLVQNVPVAESEAAVAAENISRKIAGQKPKRFVPLKKYPFILAVGGKYAIADLIFVRFSGLWGWLAKQLVELRYFLRILPIKKAIRLWLYCCKIYVSND